MALLLSGERHAMHGDDAPAHDDRSAFEYEAAPPQQDDDPHEDDPAAADEDDDPQEEAGYGYGV
jgi:hypothetical protein